MIRDLLVVGGGPAGLATAIDAAQHGLRTTVVERRPGVLDKACGEGLMPGAWRALRALGIDHVAGHPLEGIRYQRGDHKVAVAFGEPGRGVRRVKLHEALIDRAEQLGVERVQASVTEVHQHPEHVCAAGIQARYLVAADGLHSPIRAQLGLARPTRWPARYGLRRHFAMRPWTSHVEVHWADDAEAYVTPVDDDLVGLAFLFGERARRRMKSEPGRPFDKLLTRFPVLQARLETPATSARGAGPFAHRSARRVVGRVLLVGDAAGYLDPLTGEGLKLGLRGARAAVAAIVAEQPLRYERAWRNLYRTYAAATGGLLLLTRPQWARRCLVPVVGRMPSLMRAVVRVLSH